MPYKDRTTQLAAQKRNYEENRALWRQRQQILRDNVREYIDSIKKKNRCKCGITDYRLLCFHHRDPDEKEVSIEVFRRDKWSKKRIDAELAKCDIMCHHCHILLHWELRQKDKT